MRGSLVCLDRKGGTFTLDPGPLFVRECVCVFIPLPIRQNRFFQTLVRRTDGPHRRGSPMQVRMNGVSCPKVQRGGVVGC